MHTKNRRRLREIALFVVLCLAASAHAAPSRVADAVKSQDWPALRALLDTGADVNAPQGDGATALHWAAYWDDLQMARLLITAGATVGTTNGLGVSPLWLACNNGSAVMIGALLDAGADPNAALPSGETPLMTASRTGSADAVRQLLTYGAVRQLLTYGAVRQLLTYGADANATESSHGQTALMWAVAQRHPAIVRMLLEHGANINDRSHVYQKVISSSGNADPSGVYDIAQGGYTPLLFAARQGDLESARLLVAAGADVNDAAPMGTSTLVVAALSGHGALAAFLLESGADPNAADAGYTAVHAAVLRGDPDLVTALMAHGADPNAPLMRGTPARRVSTDWTMGHNLIGATPLWLAARFREPEIMRVLAENGADPLVSKDGATAVMAALQGGTTRGRFGVSADRSEEARLTIAAVELALDAGADVDGTNERGDTALHIAATRRLDDVITLLAERGATLDVRNTRGQTPLSVASTGPQGLAALYNPGGGSPSTVALLRELGATDEGGVADPQQ